MTTTGIVGEEKKSLPVEESNMMFLLDEKISPAPTVASAAR